MSASMLTKEPQACFRFKTSFTPCTIMQLTRYDLNELQKQINITVNKAPNFFIGSPVVLDLEMVKNYGILDFDRIKKILLENNLVPVGIRGGNEDQHAAAATAGFPVITIGKLKTAEETPKKRLHSSAKLITQPVRSGMQVYAKDTDLIVLSSVSPGAELLADGNIHVYGPLRGRALAGVQGDIQARIFCRTLEAELVAIAGYYLVKEDMHNFSEDLSSIQIYLDGETVKLASM